MTTANNEQRIVHRRIWRVLHRRRAERGFEPVRCCCDCRLIGWLKVPEGIGRRYVADDLEPVAGVGFIQLDRDVVSFKAEPGCEFYSGEHAWQSRDYPVEALRQIPAFEGPYPEELNYDPVNPDPISTIPGEPNYSPTYPEGDPKWNT